MTKYLINRVLRGLISVVIVVGIVMVMVYSCLDRNLIFAADPNYTHMKGNAKEVYMMQQWEKYGYVDYVTYADYLLELKRDGEIDQTTYDSVVKIGNKATQDNDEVAAMVQRFTEEMQADGYDVERLDAKMKGKTKKYQDGGEPRLYAYKDVPLLSRLGNYITGIFEDSGDIGNEYIYVQSRDGKTVRSTEFSPKIRLLSASPVMARFSVKTCMRIPAGADLTAENPWEAIAPYNDKTPGIRVGECCMEVENIVTLRAGMRRVEFETILNNNADNHRVRVLTTSNLVTDSVEADTPFDVVRRSIVPWEDADRRTQAGCGTAVPPSNSEKK